MSAELATLAADPSRVAAVERDEIPALIGEAEALRAALWARLQQAPVTEIQPRPAPGPDELLTAVEAAERLGVSRQWVYRHQDTLPFMRRLGAGTLRFSARGLERWMESRR
jgi:excisionase family DNA binding protein